MKKNKNIRLVEEVIQILKDNNREPTHDNVTSWIMGQFGVDDYNWGKYGCLHHGDISQYFKHFHD